MGCHVSCPLLRGSFLWILIDFDLLSFSSVTVVLMVQLGPMLRLLWEWHSDQNQVLSTWQLSWNWKRNEVLHLRRSLLSCNMGQLESLEQLLSILRREKRKIEEQDMPGTRKVQWGLEAIDTLQQHRMPPGELPIRHVQLVTLGLLFEGLWWVSNEEEILSQRVPWLRFSLLPIQKVLDFL